MGKRQNAKIAADANRLVAQGMTLEEAASKVGRSTTWLWEHGVRAGSGSAPEAASAELPAIDLGVSQAEALAAWGKNFEGDDDVASSLPPWPHEPPGRRLTDRETNAVVFGDYDNDTEQLSALKSVFAADYDAMTDAEFAAALASGGVRTEMVLDRPSPPVRLLHQIAMNPDVHEMDLTRVCLHRATHPRTLFELADRSVSELKETADSTDTGLRRLAESKCAHVLDEIYGRADLHPTVKQLIVDAAEYIGELSEETHRMIEDRRESEYAQLPEMTAEQFAEVLAEQDYYDDSIEEDFHRRQAELLQKKLGREPTPADWLDDAEERVSLYRSEDARFTDSQHEQLRQRIAKRLGSPR